ncbi:hypothetical protein OZ411_42195 [Bradyrhizobium sp. Arg237L]|uniref:hypothetical protein n=1 Tax=Bradyrhizobium sp. Arg237L TaxID=3003352 RepID=UPI00249E8A2F|nr:hypothetical protein [Bradyrhizobium sp. Arg237L]MDI4239405.1 hypothetical protein [Bradyrhizobium sp. Arg237L]
MTENAGRMGLASVLVPEPNVRSAALHLVGEIAECAPARADLDASPPFTGLAERVATMS